MTVDVPTEILISRPRVEVAEYAADLDNTTRWYSNIDEVTWETEPPLRVGSRVAFRARFLGRRLTYTYEVRELDPGRRLVMSTADGAFAMETTYEWEDAPGGSTRMTLRNRGEPSGFGNIVGPAVAAAMRRANQKDLERIKSNIESTPQRD